MTPWKRGFNSSPPSKVSLMTGYAQEPPPHIVKEVQILHKPFNGERLCAMAAEMTA